MARALDEVSFTAADRARRREMACAPRKAKWNSFD
jgi:hypothetical protein